MKKSRYEYPVPEHQADADINQANPISGTEYTVLETTRNVRILSITARVDWTVQPTPLEIHVTIDGQVLTFTQTDPVTATWYDARISSNTAPTAEAMEAANTSIPGRAFLLEGRSVAITVETTGGTVSNLLARVKYARW